MYIRETDKLQWDLVYIADRDYSTNSTLWYVCTYWYREVERINNWSVIRDGRWDRVNGKLIHYTAHLSIGFLESKISPSFWTRSNTPAVSSPSALELSSTWVQVAAADESVTGLLLLALMSACEWANLIMLDSSTVNSGLSLINWQWEDEKNLLLLKTLWAQVAAVFHLEHWPILTLESLVPRGSCLVLYFLQQSQKGKTKLDFEKKLICKF